MQAPRHARRQDHDAGVASFRGTISSRFESRFGLETDRFQSRLGYTTGSEAGPREATKPLAGLGLPVVWCDLPRDSVEILNASHKPRVTRSIRVTATKHPHSILDGIERGSGDSKGVRPLRGDRTRGQAPL